MFCPQCGAANSDEAAFCLKCGTRLTARAQPATTIVTPVAAAEYAGFWRRLAAALLDGIIISAVTWPVSLALGIGGALFGDVAAAGSAFSWSVLTFFGEWLYYALMESSRYQATLGKMALRIIVTDLDYKRVSFGKATGRYFGKLLSVMILLMGYLMIAFTERKQGLHDMLAGTLVVQK
jgi:uncharacterized RDD family membrane protein YckC